MSKKTVLSAVILFTLCFAIVAQVSAQTAQVTIGVKEGDTFRYQATYYWNSTNAGDTVPASLVQQNNTEWIQATIKSVTGNTVTISELQHFKNGSEVLLPDDLTAVGTLNQRSVLLYAANLNAGSYVLPSADMPYYTVNDTQQRTYASGERATNYLETTLTNVDVDGDENMTIDYAYILSARYFDRQTGILVDGYFEYGSATNPGEAYAYQYNLIDTNVWDVSGSGGGGNNNGSQLVLSPEILIVSVVIIVIVVAASVFLMVRRRRKTKQRNLRK